MWPSAAKGCFADALQVDPTDDRASVGYNTVTVPKPLVTRPKVSVSTRPHILDSVMFSQILLI